MLDSAARAERIDLSSTEAAFYIWEVAQKPVAVRLPLTLIDRLESEAVENFRSLSSRGSEIGGLLLGSVLPGGPAIVTATDFELVACDYSRGPLYRFGDADLGRVEQAIEKHNSGNGPRVIGFFRSHTRKGLTVDADDLAFFEPRFPEPHQIVLLIRPFATKVSSAAIFIRENGKIATEASHREFPFRSSELTALRPGERADGISSPAPVAPTAAPATPAKPQARAQIVPIASRREITLPDPVVSTPAPPPLVAERIEAPAPPPALAKAQAPAPALEKPVIEKPAVEKPILEKAVPDKEDRAEDKAKEKAVAPPAPLVEPAVEKTAPAVAGADIVLPIPAKKNKKLRLMVAAAAGMLVVAGSMVVYPMLTKHPAPPRGGAQQDSSPLSLRAERTSGGMLLTWNRDLPVIQGATKVVLSISDGDRHENIQLDPNQVRTGSILYPPMTGDVSFQMEVTDPNQAKTTSESLRVLDPRPSPLDDPAAKQAAAKETSPAKPAVTDPAPAPTEEAKAVEETAAAHPAAALKPFNTASLAQRLRPASTSDVPLSPTDLPDAPVIGRASAPTSASLPGIEISQPAAPAPPRPAAPSASSSAAVLKTGGQLVQAKVISRVDPEYPKLARQAGASGVVELEATISADGKVKNPRVVHGNSMLQKAAIDAVLQWHYQPAMLNGKPVESPVEIKLNFVASR